MFVLFCYVLITFHTCTFWWEGVRFLWGKMRYKDVRFIVISVTREWVSSFLKKRYITLAWSIGGCVLVILVYG